MKSYFATGNSCAQEQRDHIGIAIRKKMLSMISTSCPRAIATAGGSATTNASLPSAQTFEQRIDIMDPA